MIFKVLSLLLFLISGCGRVDYSPFVANNYEASLNTYNVALIEENSQTANYPFKVALISDTHDYYDELSKLVKKINSENYAFVIHAGDLTNYGLLLEFELARSFLKKIRSPLIATIGNHDLLSNGALIFKKMFGKTTFSFSYLDCSFSFFNNNNWESSEYNNIINWVDNDLQTSNRPCKILVAHVPPDDKDRFNDAEILQWSNLVSTYSVNYFVGGHNHNPGVSSFGGATYITIGSTNKRSYYELVFDGVGVTHRKVNF